MFKDFELAAIITKGTQKELRYIPLEKKLKDSIKKEWESQYNKFSKGVVEEVDFDPGYKPEKHELFCLREYELPNWLAKEDSASIRDFNPIRNNETQLKLIKGIATFIESDTDEEFILFQRFMPSQVIRTSLSAIWDRNTFNKMDDPGFMLANYLSAVYHRSERKLLFRSFYNVDKFLPLSEYFRPASEEEIREILSHELFAPENLEVSVSKPSQLFRNKFALLKRSDILDRFTVREIEDRSKGLGVQIQLSEDNEKIVFPTKKSDALKLLRFLNEEFFHGAVTGDPYKTNSKTKIDQ